MRLEVGSIVHYVEPGGENPSQCRAAIITDVPDDDMCALAVFQLTSMLFVRCFYDGGMVPKDGTWHWPCGGCAPAAVEV